MEIEKLEAASLHLFVCVHAVVYAALFRSPSVIFCLFVSETQLERWAFPFRGAPVSHHDWVTTKGLSFPPLGVGLAQAVVPSAIFLEVP